MFCPGCGTENPAQAAFCLKCGANLPQGMAAQGYGAPPQAFPGDAAASAAAQPYVWGYIHGWAMLIGGPLLFLIFLAVLMDPKSDSETHLGAIILMVLTGLHVLFVGICLLAVVGKPGDPSILTALGVCLIGLAFWSMCSVYYYRRRHIFG